MKNQKEMRCSGEGLGLGLGSRETPWLNLASYSLTPSVVGKIGGGSNVSAAVELLFNINLINKNK